MMDPPIPIETLRRLPTFAKEEQGQRTAFLTFEVFLNGKYFGNRQPPRYLIEFLNSRQDRQAIPGCSLKTLLELEKKQDERNRARAIANRVYTHILDHDLPIWLEEMNINQMPPETRLMILVADRAVAAYERRAQHTGIGLQVTDFSKLLRKLSLCFPSDGRALYRTFEGRSAVYCGLCEASVSESTPMSLGDMTYHLEEDHADRPWTTGILRYGQIKFDGKCHCCKSLVLVKPFVGEIYREKKSGVRCSFCGNCVCFNCMDTSIWLHPDREKVDGSRKCFKFPH